MPSRILAGALAGVLSLAAIGPARADNAMGYRLLTAQAAQQLPRRGGTLGLDLNRAEQISDGGMVFDLMRVTRVRPGSAGAQAGFSTGDEIIAVDGQVFPSLAAFAGYVGSVAPGTQIAIDTIPAGGGPAQAQRITATVGGARAAAATPAPAPAESQGMSTGTKLAIGAGAVALLGCYELGCFSHKAKPPLRPAAQPPVVQQR